jgi:RimJ/RimL family protein N-acetyltransferase
MLRGERVGLRARHESDLPILLEELYNDVAIRVQADSRPWRPIPPDSTSSPYSVADAPDSVACFSVVDLESTKLVGEALLWGIDLHNRLAHIGISLRPPYRGQDLSRDVVRVLCHYGFVIRGLNRLQIDTLADNAPMRRVASALGFTHEATFRKHAWVMGEFQDEVAYGLLADEWVATQDARSTD